MNAPSNTELSGIIHDLMAQVKQNPESNPDGTVRQIFIDQLFDAAPVGLAISDAEHKIIRINKCFTEMFGFTPEETIDNYIDDLIVSTTFLPEADSATAEVACGDNIVEMETQRHHKDGSRIDVSLHAAPIIVEGAHVAHFCVYRDMSCHRQAQEELQAIYNEMELRVAERTMELSDAFRQTQIKCHQSGEWLARTSREIREPLTTMLVTIDNLLGHRLDPELRRHIESLKRDAEKLLALAGELTKFSAEEQAEHELVPA